MKTILLLLFAACCLRATPIVMTGSGSWEQSLGDPWMHVAAFGDGAFFAYEDTCHAGPWVGATVHWNLGCATDATIFGATIGSVRSHFFSVSLDGGSGELTLYDAQNNVIASADLIGWVNVTSFQQTGLAEYQGTFSIVQTPEPSFWLALSLAVGIGLLWQTSRYRNSLTS